MKFGIILPNFGRNSTTSGVQEITTRADSLNFDSVWTTDHILLPEPDSARFGNLFEAISTLCFLAGATEKIRLGVSSLVLPQRDPILSAKQVATLDAFSNGRAMLCLGVGWSEGEYRYLGSNFHDRGKRLDEAIHLFRTLWSSTPDVPISFEGKFHHFQDAIFSPSPRQTGGPPIWIGGHSEAAIRRAAKLGDGWHPSGLTLEKFIPLASEYFELSPPKDSILSARLSLSFDSSEPTAHLTGPPDEVVQTLKKFQKAGLQYAVISLPGKSTGEQLEAMELLAEEIVPHF
jgi:probable F420-dependent oxidoreductase